MDATLKNTFNGSYEQVEEAARYIKSHADCTNLDIGIVCGSGLGRLGEVVQNSITIDYSDIPYFQKLGTYSIIISRTMFLEHEIKYLNRWWCTRSFW